MSAPINIYSDFVWRTAENQKRIDEGAAKSRHKYFEVTQLINSALGILFIPRETSIEKFRGVDAGVFVSGLRTPRLIFGDLRTHDAAGLLIYFRNAFAHLNFDFETRGGVIRGVYLWNRNRDHAVDWVAYVTVEDLHEIFSRFANEFRKLVPRDAPENSPLTRIEMEVGQQLRISNIAGL